MNMSRPKDPKNGAADVSLAGNDNPTGHGHEFRLFSSLETGHKAIDDDHRKIIAHVNQVTRVLRHGEVELGRELLDTLIEKFREHFRYEEEMLEKSGFPRIQQHKAFHQQLLERARSFRETCQSGDNVVSADCFDELAALLIDDMVQGDSDFVSFLEEKASRD